MSQIAEKLGPADHGRRMNLADFEHAETAEGCLYELGRGVIIVSEVPNPPHLAQVTAIRRQLSAYDVAHPGRIYAVAGGADQPVVGAVHLAGRLAARRRASGPESVTVGIAEAACTRGRAGDLPIDALGSARADRAGGAVRARAVEPGEDVPRRAQDALAAVAHRGGARDGIHARRPRLAGDADLVATGAVVVPGHEVLAGRVFIAGDDVIHQAAGGDGG